MANRTKFTNRARERFLATLRESGNVSQAARAAGISRRCAYDHKNADEDFAAEWEEAEESASDDLERIAWERAAGWKDEASGKYVYSDRMLELLLKARRPDKFKERAAHEHTGEDGGPLNISIVRYGDSE